MPTLAKARIMGVWNLSEGAVLRKMAVCFCSNFIIFGKIKTCAESKASEAWQVFSSKNFTH